MIFVIIMPDMMSESRSPRWG